MIPAPGTELKRDLNRDLKQDGVTSSAPRHPERALLRGISGWGRAPPPQDPSGQSPFGMTFWGLSAGPETPALPRRRHRLIGRLWLFQHALGDDQQGLGLGGLDCTRGRRGRAGGGGRCRAGWPPPAG